MTVAAVAVEDTVRLGWPTARTRTKEGSICPRCRENPVKVELIVQARSTKRPKPGAFGTRSRRVCEPCGQELFHAMLVAMEVEPR